MFSTCIFAGMRGGKHYFSKYDLKTACIRENMVLFKIEIPRPCADPSKSESLSEAWKPLFLTSFSFDSYTNLTFGLVADSNELVIFMSLVVVCS